jgi:hypothetical protein
MNEGARQSWRDQPVQVRPRRGIWTNLFGGSKKNSEENSKK